MGRETGAHAGAKGSQSRSLSFPGPVRLSDRAGQGCAVSSGTDDVQTTDVHSHARLCLGQGSVGRGAAPRHAAQPSCSPC
jgi:hypothetical protein